MKLHYCILLFTHKLFFTLIDHSSVGGRVKHAMLNVGKRIGGKACYVECGVKDWWDSSKLLNIILIDNWEASLGSVVLMEDGEG